MSDGVLDQFDEMRARVDGNRTGFDHYFIGAMSSHAETVPAVRVAFLSALETARRCVTNVAQSSLASAPPHEVEAPVVAATGDNDDGEEDE